MSATDTAAPRKMGTLTLLSAIFILVTVVWGAYTLILVQGGLVRSEIPHEEYTDVQNWPYNVNNWTGGTINWWEGMNNTQASLNVPPPENLTSQENNTLYIIEPASPPQLWRASAYDHYDGGTWSKTSNNQPEFTNFITRNQANSYGTEIYTVTFNITGGSTVGNYELPTLFPGIQVIRNSFVSYPADAILQETFYTDDYGTLLYGPLVSTSYQDIVTLSYNVTYTQQDLNFIANNALSGSLTPSSISSLYGDIGVSLSQGVLDEIHQFDSVGTTAYEKASAVETYFQTNYQLILTNPEYLERPAEGEEATEWFIQRGGGLPYDFASAYCVFMRELGISARPVYGYAIGDDFGDHRELMVKHMFFWAEVYIPTVSGGEWIQIFPFSTFAEPPENTEYGNVQLTLNHYTSTPNPWVTLGETFQLSAILYVEGVPTGLGGNVQFYDYTAGHYIGSSTIQSGTYAPAANITFAFPIDDPAGPHNITAYYQNNLYTAYAFHNVYAVATPEPFSSSEISLGMLDYVTPVSKEEIPKDAPLAETIDVNLKLGFDNYTAFWTDTLQVHGTLTHQGQPIDGTTLNNDQMEIYWDGVWYGNATIQSDGTYSLGILLDPLDLSRMWLGDHWTNSYYAGEYDEGTGYPIYLPATSAPSNVTLYGKVELYLDVNPQTTTPGSTLSYTGTLTLLNGTALSGEDVVVYFNGTAFNTLITGVSGQFSTTYPLGSGHPLGIFPANASWTSSYPLVASNVSETIWITVSLSTTYLSINSTPAPYTVVHTLEPITIWGQLTNDTQGLAGYDIDVFWRYENLTVVNLGPVTTNASGYYEVTYYTEVFDEGIIDYWAEFTPAGPGLTASQSQLLWIEVRKYYTQVFLIAPPGPYRVTDQITLQALVYLPELGGALGGVPVTFYWENGTLPIPSYQNMTSLFTAIATYTFTIPLDHAFTNVSIYVVFNSPSVSFYSNTSVYEYRIVTNYATSITSFADSTNYYLNETVHIYGQLTSDGPVMNNYPVDMVWDYGNGTTRPFSAFTDPSGNYDFYVSLNLGDGIGTISVQVSYTPATRLFNGSLSSLTFDTQLYLTEFITSLNNTEYHLDEVLEFSGVLRFNDGFAPLRGASITIYYLDGNGLQSYPKTTDNTGSFTFYYNFSMVDALGAIYVWAEYLSTNPLWTNAISANETATLLLYQFNLTITTAELNYHLNESVYVTGYLTYLHNGTPLQNQGIQMTWDNGTLPTPMYQWYYTDGTGFFQFIYNLSISSDSLGSVDIRASWTNTNPMWDNALSNIRTINIQLYQFNMTIFSANGTSYYHLNNTAYIRGQLTYLDNGAPLANEPIRIFWDNGTLPTPEFQWYYTDANGYFDFYYNFSSTDALGPISLWAEWTNANPLWDNAISNTLDLNLQLYQFDLTLFTDAGSYYLNQTVHVYGWLRFSANMAGLGGQTVTVYWDNGTLPIPIFTDVTDSSGYFEIYYLLTTAKDAPGSVDIWAEFKNSNPLWDNATSSLEVIDLQKYQYEINAFVPSTVYLDQSLLIQGNVTYQGGSPIAVGVTVNIYIWSGGMWSFVDTVVTDGFGTFQYLYDFTVPPDTAGPYTFRCNTSSGPLYNDAITPDLDTTAMMYLVNLDVYAVPSAVYLNESLFIQAHLYYTYNMSGVNNGEVSIWWFNGTDRQILTLYTNTSGWAEWYYSGFQEHTAWNVEVTATFAGGLITSSNDTRTDIAYVTLQQWATDIIGFGSDLASVNPTQTVQIFGALQYTPSGLPISATNIELYIDGFYETDLTTLADGSFNYYWTVETWRSTGDHFVTVYYASGVNWIEDAQAGPLTITVTRLGLSINSFNVAPNPVYLTYDLTISGQLMLSNGSPYTYADVELWWNHLSGTAGDELIITVQSDGTGWFSHSFSIPSSTMLGLTEVWANCTPSSIFIDSASTIRVQIDIQKVSVIISLYVTNSTRYVGDFLSIGGTFRTFNSTPLVGYNISLIWQNSTFTTIATVTTTSGRAFFLNYQIPWRHTEGPCYLYARFLDTNPIYAGNRSSTLAIEIWYRVDVHLDDQTVFTIARGNSLTISGYVEDSYGLVPDMILTILVNNVSTGISTTTGSDGLFSTSLDIPSTTTPGTYVLSLRLSSINVVVDYNDDYWTVVVGIETTLSVRSEMPYDMMTGEHWDLTLSASDESQATPQDIIGITVNLYLVSEDESYETFLQSATITSYNTRVSIHIPASIPSGNYSIRMDFSGSGNYLASTTNSAMKHIFLQSGIDASLAPTVQGPNTQFDIILTLVDENGVPIRGRAITINVNATGDIGPVTTDQNGRAVFSFTSGPSLGILTVTASMDSPDFGDVDLGEFSIQIAATGPPDWNLILLLFWICLIGVEAIIAGLVVTRFRRRRATSTTYIRTPTSIKTVGHQDNHFIRW